MYAMKTGKQDDLIPVQLVKSSTRKLNAIYMAICIFPSTDNNPIKTW